MSTLRFASAAWLLGQAMPAQELLWQVTPSNYYLGPIRPFVDYNGDGYRDLLESVLLNYGIPGLQILVLQVLSGADASVLLTSSQPEMMAARFAGDMNQDGYPDVALLQDRASRSVAEGQQQRR